MTPDLPGLDRAGRWDMPARLNMAAQCLEGPDGSTTIINLTRDALRDVSRAELARMSDGLARRLLRQVNPGDRVGVLLNQSPWCAAAYLAIWKIGAISVPFSELFKHDALRSRIGDADLQLVLTDPEGAWLLGDLATALMVDEVGEDSPPVDFADTGPEDPALLIYTLGTTSSPKGALHGHRVLTGHLPGVAPSHDLLGQSGDCLWTLADRAWIGGLFDVLMPGLTVHAAAVVARTQKVSAQAAKEVVRRGSAPTRLEGWHNPQATAEKFHGDWLIVGDRGQWQGTYLRFVGREDDVITSVGCGMGPAEIEGCLLTHPAVATVGVVGTPDQLRTEIVKVYVVLKPGAEASAETLQEWVKARLANYLYPREITFLDALPMTVTGKVIRKELKRRAAAEEEMSQ